MKNDKMLTFFDTNPTFGLPGDKDGPSFNTLKAEKKFDTKFLKKIVSKIFEKLKY